MNRIWESRRVRCKYVICAACANTSARLRLGLALPTGSLRIGFGSFCSLAFVLLSSCLVHLASLALSYIFSVPVMPQRRLTPRTSRATSLHPCCLLFPFIAMDTVSLVYSALSPFPRNLIAALEPYPYLGIHSRGEQFLRLFQFTSLLPRRQVTW